MAIDNLSGNIQPVLKENGKSLPSLANGKPSTSVINGSNETKVASFKRPLASDDRGNSQQLSPKDLSQAQSEIERLQDYNQQISRSLQFSIDNELGVTIVKVVDKATDELIRQFPPEELINLSKRLKDLTDEGILASGVLLQEKV